MIIFLSAAGHMGDQMIARIMADRITVLGHKAMLDLNGIRGGENWKVQTREAIKEADWFLALLSPSYHQSKHTNWHLAQALQLNKRILPVLISDTEHYLLDEGHYIDLRSNVDNGVQELIQRLTAQQEFEQIEELADFAKKLTHDEVVEKAAEISQDARVFIAYSRKQREEAKMLYELLSKHGKAVFWDAKIHAGATWRQTIQKALDDATHVVVIWTIDAAESDEVEREVSYALSEGKVIIPILSKDIPKLPYHLHGFHYVILDENLSTIEHDIITAIESISNDDIWQ